ETTWGLPTFCAARADLAPGWPGWWEAALSRASAIAPVEITKNAREMPMVRRISIRHVSFLLYTPARRRDAALPLQWYWIGLGDADRCRPVLLPMHPGRTGGYVT